MKTMIPPTPFDKKGKTFTLVLVLTLAAIWLVSIYAYFDLPAEVPTHFGFTGRPTSYGNKATFLLLPFLFSIAPVIFLLIIRFRFTLINKYPYLVNLPAFFTNINKIEENR